VEPEVEEAFDLAVAYMRDGHPAAAEPSLQALTGAHPDLTGPRLDLAIVYAATERPCEAEALFRQVLAADPDHAVAHNQLGILLRRAGRFEAAREEYEAALQADPSLADAVLNLGVLYDLYLQQPAEALAQYQRYQDLRDEEDKEVTLWIAELKRRLPDASMQATTEEP